MEPLYVSGITPLRLTWSAAISTIKTEQMVSSIPPCSLLLPWAFIATEAFSGQFCPLEEHFVSFETIKDSSHLFAIFFFFHVLSHFRHVRLFRPYDCSPPGSSVHGILQAKILGWVAVPSSRGSSWPRDRTCLLYLLHWQAGSLPLSPPGKPTNQDIHSEINIEREKQLVRWYIPKKKVG